MPTKSLDALIRRPKSIFANGAWRSAGGAERLSVVDPSTGRAFAEVGAANTADVAAAVDAALAAFPRWAGLPGARRGTYLQRFADGLARRHADLVDLQMLNNGKPHAEAEMDVGDAIATFAYYAEMAEALDQRQGEALPMSDPSLRGRTRFEPLGPVGMIVPWNFPLVTSAWKIAPALAAGCTVVLKTSEFTPLIELVYGDIALDAELPEGALNFITGSAEAGAALTGDRRLRKLSFTGSNMVGAKVMAAAAARCVPVSLELGGKSPIVVFADADIERAVDYVAGGIFFNCGQMCSATSRLIVEDWIAPALLDRLAARAKALRTGSPVADDAEMGPITTRPQYEKVLRTFEQARADRLTCIAGGAGGAGTGHFVQPTIYLDVPLDHTIWREEIFGPALAVRRFKTEDEAVALANDSDYGLVATIVSGDAQRAERIAARIDAGHIWINSLQVIPPNTAWGGFKASGIGRELGPWGLSAYLGVKHLTISAGSGG